MRLSKLEFGAFFTYIPRADSPEAKRAHDVMLALKQDWVFPKFQMPMSQWVAQALKKRMNELPFASFFLPTTILIPIPKSTLMKQDTLWVPHRLALALVGVGLGKDAFPCLIRNKPLPKATSSLPKDRPTAVQHYESMEVQRRITRPEEIVLVDDVVTRGATLLGAANRLLDAFPRTHIHALAIIRTISNPDEFQGLYDPCIRKIELLESGETSRIP